MTFSSEIMTDFKEERSDPTERDEVLADTATDVYSRCKPTRSQVLL